MGESRAAEGQRDSRGEAEGMISGGQRRGGRGTVCLGETAQKRWPTGDQEADQGVSRGEGSGWETEGIIS